jgi:hypothetical protein
MNAGAHGLHVHVKSYFLFGLVVPEQVALFR